MTTPEPNNISNRKTEHIRICLTEDVQARGIGVGLDEWRFVHQALPEIDLAEIDLRQPFLGKTLAAPLLISSMTGGADWGTRINRTLAQAAQKWGLAMGVGSQRAAIENSELRATYAIRELAPDCVLLANLGAVQLNYGYGLKQCMTAVEMLQADGLILHLNALQEAVQPSGNVNFKGLLSKIASVCEQLARYNVPVIVKEVGNGISEQAARQLVACGVAGIDVGGSGGTSWSQVESFRVKRAVEQRAAAAFADWGIPTAQSLLWVSRVALEVNPKLVIIASGGIRNGVDVAKAIALNAGVAGMALPFLKAAEQGLEAVNDLVEQTLRELRIAMFCIGSLDIGMLRDTSHLIRI